MSFRKFTHLGTALSSSATKAMLLGSGELGKEVVIELQRFGVETIAVDRYPDAPATHVAHRAHVIDMLDPAAVRALVEAEKPDLIIPEIEAIATNELLALEQDGFNVLPSAKATNLTMNREGIRRLAAEGLNLATSPYRFAYSESEFKRAIEEIGLPCGVKPTMSSSGKGQSTVKDATEMDKAWTVALEGSRGEAHSVIIEGFVDFDYEITLLTVQHSSGVAFCQPIGHRQEHGDYQESWQPHLMRPETLEEWQMMANKVTGALGGWGLFGVEFLIQGDKVLFSEVSPRPHDTGMVTMISQDLSEFALHARAILGLPIPGIRQRGPAASAVILGHGHGDDITFSGLSEALKIEDTQIRLFGKPEVRGERRLGVALALGESIEEARSTALAAAKQVEIEIR